MHLIPEIKFIWKTKKKETIIIIASLALILLVISFFVFGKNNNSHPESQELKEAAETGEKVTNKLLVQIEIPKGQSEDVTGRFERGDIILIAPADKEFSPAEKGGFLILKMELTPKQAEILIQPKEEVAAQDAKENPAGKNLKRRRFSVDLSRIGIKPDDERGKEMEKIYKWDIIFEK